MFGNLSSFHQHYNSEKLYEPTKIFKAKLFTLHARTNKNCQNYLSRKLACVDPPEI